ncbi:MAG: hypothetical protein K8T91_10445 [Planctomycetes bacterium]|nr:hypothetical protein [Planctomycetota bacterium]
MPDNTILHRCGSLLFGDKVPAISAAKKRASSRMIRVEFLEPRTVMSATSLPIEFTVPTTAMTQEFYVSITAQLNANYNGMQTGDWVYYDPSTNDYALADSTTPSADLTFQVTNFVGTVATIDVPYTPVVSGHIVMGVGSAPVVAYANNPQTNQGGISAPTPGGPNYDKIYGLFEYALAVDASTPGNLLVDVDMSEVDQVGFPFTITATPATQDSPVDLGTGITQNRDDMFALYQQYITDKGIYASSFKQLVQKDSTGDIIRIMAPNNYVDYAPSPVPAISSIGQLLPGTLPPDSGFYYWVTATNGYGESMANNPQNQTTKGSSGGHPVEYGSLQVNWTAISGATGYKIYRAPVLGSGNNIHPGTPQFLSKWNGTVNGQGNPYFVDNGSYTTTSNTFPTTNYSYFPQNYYFNNALQQFFNYYATNTFSIDVPMTMPIAGHDLTAMYTLSGKTVNNFVATGTDNASHNYTALVLTGTTSAANITLGFPDTTGQQFAVLRPYFQQNMNSNLFPPAPIWISNPTESPGVMVFGNDGVFNTGGEQPGVNAQLLSNLENPIVSAFNRGVATNFPIAPNNWANAPDVYAATALPGGSLAADAYYYVVTATNQWGQTTASLEYSAVADATNKAISLQWKADNEPTQYNIYRSTTQGSGYQLIAAVANPDVTNHNIPVTLFVDTGYSPVKPTPQHPAPALLTPMVYYAPGTTSNWYAGFFHQNVTDNPTTGVSIRGLAYGFAYDDQGSQSTNMNDHYTQININLEPWGASQTPPVNFDPTPNVPVDVQILMQPKSARSGSFTTISFKAFGPEGQAFTGGTQVTVEVVGAQRGTYLVNVNPITGFGILTFKSTDIGYNYLKITQSDGKVYNSKVFNTLPTSIPLSLMYIFDQECERLSKNAGFYTSLDQIARSRR